jgi:hypothetical protein
MTLKLKKLNMQGSSHIIVAMLVVIGAGILGTYELVASHADSLTATQQVAIMEWNIAGDAMHHGQGDPQPSNYATGKYITDKVVTEILHNDTIRATTSPLSDQVIALSEVCYGQYKEIQNSLVAAGWPADKNNFSRYEKDQVTNTNGSPICADSNNTDKGNTSLEHTAGIAMFSRDPLGPADIYTICQASYNCNIATDTTPAPKNNPTLRKLLCASVLYAKNANGTYNQTSHLEFCATHVSTDSNHNAQELAYIQAKLKSYQNAGDTVITAGDFNDQPFSNNGDTSMTKYLYSDNIELDQQDPNHCPDAAPNGSYDYGEYTTVPTTTAAPKDYVCKKMPNPANTKKIDYIFVTKGKLDGGLTSTPGRGLNAEDTTNDDADCASSIENGNTYAGQCSDHRIVNGSAMVYVNE